MVSDHAEVSGVQNEVQITFHNLSHSDLLEADIRTRVDKLVTLYDRIIGCRVVLEGTNRGAVKAKAYAVKIEIQVPGPDLVVKSEPVADCHQAITSAFDSAKRRLKEHADRVRGG